MIEINLLPDDYRRAGKTPPRTLGLMMGATVLSFGALGLLAYFYMNVRADAANRVEIAQQKLENLKPQADYADSLEKEKADFERRNKTIQEIARSRILWTRKMDRLSAIVNTDVSTGRHQVWLDQLDVNSKMDTRTAGGVKVKGASATANIESVSNFHEDLRTDPDFAEGFVEFTAPKSKLGSYDKELDPHEKMEFEFEIKLPSVSPLGQAPAPAQAQATK